MLYFPCHTLNTLVVLALIKAISQFPWIIVSKKVFANSPIGDLYRFYFFFFFICGLQFSNAPRMLQMRLTSVKRDLFFSLSLFYRENFSNKPEIFVCIWHRRKAHGFPPPPLPSSFFNQFDSSWFFAYAFVLYSFSFLSLSLSLSLCFFLLLVNFLQHHEISVLFNGNVVLFLFSFFFSPFNSLRIVD